MPTVAVDVWVTVGGSGAKTPLFRFEFIFKNCCCPAEVTMGGIGTMDCITVLAWGNFNRELFATIAGVAVVADTMPPPIVVVGVICKSLATEEIVKYL